MKDRIRVNLNFTPRQYEAIKRNAKALEVRPGTWARMSVLNAAGCQYAPDEVIMPSKIKQLSLCFERGKK